MISPHTNLFSKSELDATCSILASRAAGVGAEDALDDTGSLWRFRAAADRPRADLVGSTCEVVDQLMQRACRSVRGEERKAGRTYVKAGVTNMCDPGECTLGADLLLFLGLFFWRHERQPLLKRDGERNEQVTRVVLVDPRLDLR